MHIGHQLMQSLAQHGTRDHRLIGVEKTNGHDRNAVGHGRSDLLDTIDFDFTGSP